MEILGHSYLRMMTRYTHVASVLANDTVRDALWS